MQRLKIDVSKIDESALFKGAKGTYLDLSLLDNRDGTDEWGNDGFIVQDIGKERREAGEKGPIIGNWKHVGQTKPRTVMPKPNPTADAIDEDESSIPF